MSSLDENSNRQGTAKILDNENEGDVEDCVANAEEEGDEEGNVHNSDDEEDEGSEYETDIEELECKNDEFDPTGRTRYLNKCKELNIVPVSNFLTSLTTPTCDVTHHCVGPQGAQAITRALIHNVHVTQLLMRDNDIQPEGSIYVGKLLRENYNITHVDLSQNKVGHTGAHVTARVLEENRTLRVLYLAENDLKDKDAQVLAEALKHNSALQHLDLSRNKFGEDAGVALGSAIDINTGLKTLDLSWNHLRGRGAIAIAKGSAANLGLRTLLLAWNGFGEDGACAVSTALKENTHLEELDISNNRISVKGCLDVASALKVNTTLKILRIGRSPFGSKGAHALLTALKANQETGVETLDLHGVVIDQDSQEMLGKVLEVKPDFQIFCEFSQSGGQLGKDLEDAYNRRIRAKKFDAEYMIGILKQYVKSNNLRLVDLFNQFDKDKDQSVSREELVRGFRSMKVPLSDEQLDMFMRELDTDGDGEIDYSEFTWINDAD